MYYVLCMCIGIVCIVIWLIGIRIICIIGIRLIGLKGLKVNSFILIFLQK